MPAVVNATTAKVAVPYLALCVCPVEVLASVTYVMVKVAPLETLAIPRALFAVRGGSATSAKGQESCLVKNVIPAMGIVAAGSAVALAILSLYEFQKSTRH